MLIIMDSVAVNRLSMSLQICVILVSTLFVIVIAQDTQEIVPGCVTSQDFEYNGIMLNCTYHPGIKYIDIPRLYSYTTRYANITTLLLNRNPIHILKHNAFAKFGSQLRRLECKHCHISRLEVDALQGLTNLSILDLSYNDLKIKDHAFPFGFFRHVSKLTKLDISENDNDGKFSNYSRFIDIFYSLPNLKQLSIDSYENLTIGQEFSALKNLEALYICCGNLHSVSNNSFYGFESSKLRYFEMFDGALNVFAEDDDVLFFKYLPKSVQAIKIRDVPFGNKNIIKMMPALKNRHLMLLFFDNVGFYHKSLRNVDWRLDDRIFSDDFSGQIKDVCVENFVWYNSYVLSIDFDNFNQGRWTDCLKTFVFVTGGSILITDDVYLFKLTKLKKIETFIYLLHDKELGILNFWEDEFHLKSKLKLSESGKFEFFDTIFLNYHYLHHETNEFKFIETKKADKKEINKFRFVEHNLEPGSNTSPATHEKIKEHYNEEIHTLQHEKVNSFKKGPINEIGYIRTKNKNIEIERNDNIILSRNGLPYYADHLNTTLCQRTIRLPVSLKNLVFTHVFSYHVRSETCVHKNSLQHMSIINSGERGIGFYRHTRGFNSLASLDYTGSNFESFPGPAEMFDSYPKLSKLVFRRTALAPYFYSDVAFNTKSLSYYDVAENKLQTLPADAFVKNNMLRQLSLSHNYFTNVPFDLKYTPQLETLDLRKNLLVEIPEKHRSLIDYHLNNVPNFTVLLDENPISCGCDSIQFLKWLADSKCTFDNEKNYSCSSQSGRPSNTGYIIMDLDKFWRYCNGQIYLFFSLFLMALVVALYVIVFLVIRYKTLIISIIMKTILPKSFPLRNRKDFIYDVFIGYANENGTYVRQGLLPYLETKWKLKTFVHQRDMTHDRYQLSQALADSWRCLLLITEQFLKDEMMSYHVMKVSTLLVSPTNPNRLVVMVEEKFHHRIPEIVLRVVDEEDIIILPNLHTELSYDARQTLKTRILN